jgi:hypothetical protein
MFGKRPKNYQLDFPVNLTPHPHYIGVNLLTLLCKLDHLINKKALFVALL